jgi:hypothetical protein
LKRIERAHQSGSEARNVRQVVATAVAYAPAREENEPEVIESFVTAELPLEAALEPEPVGIMMQYLPLKRATT